MTQAFSVVAPTGDPIPVVGHVPHASTVIPDDVREELLVDDDELRLELIRLTDAHTDDLFAWLSDRGATLFVNGRSRLVFDPERFLDIAREPAEGVGQGVVYTHGSQGQPLRKLDFGLRTRRVEELYKPYHAALESLVASTLAESGSCTIIDCHSFPSEPLPSELDQMPDRPDVCIGSDPAHTPPELTDALEAALSAEGFWVDRDTPFSGSFVPAAYLGTDRRVRSVMIEVRRGLYMDETSGQRSERYDDVRAALEKAVVVAGLLEAGG